MNSRLWKLTDSDLPKEFETIRNVFIGVPNDRKRNESLHDYLVRKKIKCFCKLCRYKEALANNTKLL